MNIFTFLRSAIFKLVRQIRG